jgi:hypothetical protein
MIEDFKQVSAQRCSWRPRQDFAAGPRRRRGQHQSGERSERNPSCSARLFVSRRRPSAPTKCSKEQRDRSQHHDPRRQSGDRRTCTRQCTRKAHSRQHQDSHHLYRASSAAATQPAQPATAAITIRVVPKYRRSMTSWRTSAHCAAMTNAAWLECPLRSTRASIASAVEQGESAAPINAAAGADVIEWVTSGASATRQAAPSAATDNPRNAAQSCRPNVASSWRAHGAASSGRCRKKVHNHAVALAATKPPARRAITIRSPSAACVATKAAGPHAALHVKTNPATDGLAVDRALAKPFMLQSQPGASRAKSGAAAARFDARCSAAAAAVPANTKGAASRSIDAQ